MLFALLTICENAITFLLLLKYLGTDTSLACSVGTDTCCSSFSHREYYYEPQGSTELLVALGLQPFRTEHCEIQISALTIYHVQNQFCKKQKSNKSACFHPKSMCNCPLSGLCCSNIDGIVYLHVLKLSAKQSFFEFKYMLS